MLETELKENEFVLDVSGSENYTLTNDHASNISTARIQIHPLQTTNLVNLCIGLLHLDISILSMQTQMDKGIINAVKGARGS